MTRPRLRPFVAPAVAVLAVGTLAPWQTTDVDHSDGRHERAGPHLVRGWEPGLTLLGRDTTPAVRPLLDRIGGVTCHGHRRTHYLFGLYTVTDVIFVASMTCGIPTAPNNPSGP